jgi:NADH:ubiquinone oxidoreductase subunit
MNELRPFRGHARLVAGRAKGRIPRGRNNRLRLDNPARQWHQDDTISRTGRALMKQFLLKFFTWWSGQTFGTQLWTWRFGELVGEDEQGNRYYRTKGRKIDPTLGFERRWVIYNGVAEASTIPPAWHGWMHHMVDVLPTQEHIEPRPWWKPHRPNLTGTPGAQRPTGSTLAQGRRPRATGDYKPWVPGR